MSKNPETTPQQRAATIRLRKLKGRLNLPHYAAVGIVTIVQVICAGDRLVTPESIAAALGWDGSPGELYEALLYAGYIVDVGKHRNN